MSLNMTKAEREAFLADMHVGVISIADPDPARGPLSAPIWYDYTPDRGIWVITGAGSLKGRALDQAGRYTMVAQSEAMPYKYVSAEGPIIESRDADRDEETRPMAHRYFGQVNGDLYVDSQSHVDNRIYFMRPERWLTLDYSKLGVPA